MDRIKRKLQREERVEIESVRAGDGNVGMRVCVCVYVDLGWMMGEGWGTFSSDVAGNMASTGSGSSSVTHSKLQVLQAAQ